jgi:thymidylate synthase
MWQYQNLINEILRDGEDRQDRTGVGTKAIFNKSMTFRMKGNLFPMVTIKETKYKGALGELAAFMRGSTDHDLLAQFGCSYWAHNFNAEYWADSKFKRFDSDLGKLGYSYTLRNFEGIDQLRDIMDRAWSTPHDRRLLVSHWHPKDMEESVLPPCHYSWQLFVHGSANEYVSLVWNQRSVDVMLGLPCDFVYYGALLILVANELGKNPYELSCNLGDTHIYNNHLEEAAEVATWNIYDSPTYKFTGMPYQKVEEFHPDMLKIKNYKHGPFVPLEMAV